MAKFDQKKIKSIRQNLAKFLFGLRLKKKLADLWLEL